jgi:hypothetical protein
MQIQNESLLAEIWGLARSAGCRWPDWMRPGLEGAEVERSASEKGCRLPPAARLFFQWRNGIGSPSSGGAAIGQLRAFPSFYPLGLEESLDYGEELKGFRSGIVPLFFAGGDAFLVVEPGSEQVSSLELVSGLDVISETFERFLRTWRDIYLEHAFEIDATGTIGYDRGEVRRIGIRNNPGLSFWTQYGG